MSLVERVYGHLRGCDPRLYPGVIADTLVWLFRWCADEYLEAFVGDVQGCPRRCRCEIVAAPCRRDALRLVEGSEIVLELDV